MSRYINIFKEIEKCKPKVILEIGTWNGGHACEMIRKAQEFSQYSTISYYGFDLFEDLKEKEKEFCTKYTVNSKKVLSKLNRTNANITLIKGNTRKTLRNFHPAVNIDFMFIDGGHSLETIESDWKNLKKYVLPTTIVLFDDYYLNRSDVGCRQLITRLEKDDSFIITHLLPVDEFDDLQIKMVRLQRVD